MDAAVRKTPVRGVAEEEPVLLGRALATLRELGMDAEVDPKKPQLAPFDHVVILGRGAKRTKYLVEIKRTLRPATIGPVLLRLQAVKQPVLLLTDYVTPQMAKTLRAAGVAFADAAGNAYLETNGNVFYVVGNIPQQLPRTEKIVRAFQPAGMRVAFALLCAPELIALPTRELAARLDVANGTVGRVLDDLAHLGFVTTAGRRDRRLHNLQGLLERWVMMYPAQLRPTLVRKRLTTEIQDWWKAEKFDVRHVALGGQPAANLLTDYLKPATVTLFARGEPRRINELIARYRMRTDPAGEIEVLDAFWPLNTPTERPGLVPTLLIYADLLATGDARCIETAKLVYDDYLAERFKQD